MLTKAGGLRFYDRLEIKLVLDYLRVINQPSANDALARIVNTPSRRIGDTTIKALLEEADTSRVTLWQLILDNVQGRRTIKTSIKKAQSAGLCELVNVILTGKKKMSEQVHESVGVKGLIEYVLDKLDMESYLKKQHNDETGARWDNIQELIVQANDFQDLLASGFEDDSLPEIADVEQTYTDDHLTQFLANVALASEVKSDDESAKPQLTISTIHAAKGLEWPVVFIPAAYEGSIPHSRAEDTDEERRLLYVAMTRAKALLYLSCPVKNSQGDDTAQSQFLTPEAIKLVEQKGPSLGSTVVQSIAHILRRGCPTACSIYESSQLLQSTEDNRFPIDGDEREDLHLKWSLTQGSQAHERGQRSPKRRKIALDRSMSNAKETRPAYAMTTNKTSSFLPTTTMSGFTTASHVQILSEQSVNMNAHSELSGKQISKPKKKDCEGQGTLLSFLGKAEPAMPPLKPPATKIAPTPPLNFFNRSRTECSAVVLDPSLADHRLVPKKDIKPKVMHPPDQHRANNYAFLSSSPTRPPPVVATPVVKDSIIEPLRFGITNYPKAIKYANQPSMHTTSQDSLKNNATKKTLGMRRSGDSGWSSQHTGKFKPPTMRRPGL